VLTGESLSVEKFDIVAHVAAKSAGAATMLASRTISGYLL